MPTGAVRLQGIRFDPSYYYNLNRPVEKFLDSMITSWGSNGINTVFIKPYDPQYGAVYRTHYAFNRQTDYGKNDFLKTFLRIAHKNNLRVIAWLPVLEHKGAWDGKPEWRIKDSSGQELLPFADRHFLCGNNPEVRAWWHGFILDIMKRYPEIDGFDFAEPASVWKNRIACSCAECKKSFGTESSAFSSVSIDKRAGTLTDLLLESCVMVRDAKKISCVTIIPSVTRTGNVLPFSDQKLLSGMDPDKLLNSPSHPDWISLEILWQQWADTYNDPGSFTPTWTKAAMEQVHSMVNGRAHLIAHVEMTPLGVVEVSPSELGTSIVAAQQGGAHSIELYDSHLADSLQAWDAIREAWHTRSDRKAFIFYDNDGLGLARQIATLFGHFDVRTNVIPLDSFAVSGVQHTDLIAYLGTRHDAVLPPEFVQLSKDTLAHILWMNLNLSQISDFQLTHNFYCKEIQTGNKFPIVEYKGKKLFKTDSSMAILEVPDTSRVNVHAWAFNKDGKKYPYAVQSGNFWYIADCPVDYMIEGCRHIVLADLLHDFIGENHPEQHTALVRIEDVCALTDPIAIRRIADILSAERVPFAISLVPFYVDPEENTAISLSDKPALVAALHYAVKKGASIVMHGSTHQYRGRSTGDYEFWDGVRNAPIFEDSDEYVRIRLRRGLNELHKNGLYPIIFETPHYAASQRDYAIVKEFFSAEYGRRQVIDKKGFDQLVPYLIPNHPDGVMIIPENLGYIPSDKQTAEPLIRCADNNLAVRDGFASFFFHSWIDTKVLKDLVKGIRDCGYQFSDIRLLPLKVSGSDFVTITGRQSVTLEPNGKFINTYFIDDAGRKCKNWFSEEPVTKMFNTETTVPPRWEFYAGTVPARSSLLSGFSLQKNGWFERIKEMLMSTEPMKPRNGNVARMGVIWVHNTEISSQDAFAATFKNCAIPVDTLPVEQFFSVPDSINLLVVPASGASRLSSQQILLISQFVASGGNIILEGPSELAQKVGIRVRDSSKTVKKVKDEYFPGVPVTWPHSEICYGFDADVEYVTQYSADDGTPVVASGEYGDGKYLFFASTFSDGGEATGDRYPFFLDMIEREFDTWPVVKNGNLEVYFDPGTREEITPEELVRLWKANGVRIVHIGAWVNLNDIDYGSFVKLLHNNGMLAYAWFDLPYVSEQFWIEHPEWREITAAGTQAHIGWRYLMNMTNDTSRAGCLHAVKRYLMAADWDGINLSGQMFEGDSLDSASLITPLNQVVQSRYIKEKGYDPKLIFDSKSPYHSGHDPRFWNEFRTFRDSLEVATFKKVIDFLMIQRVMKKPGSQIVITRTGEIYDLLSQESYWKLTDDNQKLRLQLAPRFNDGFDGESLKKCILIAKEKHPSWKPMVELNFDKLAPKSSVTNQLCGVELMGLIAEAAEDSVRLTLRTEENIFEVDFKSLQFASAASAFLQISKNEWTLESNHTVSIDLPTNQTAMINGNVWPVISRGSVLIPQGKHTLSIGTPISKLKSFLSSNVRILDCAASITDARPTTRGMQFSYRSELPSPVIFSEKVHHVNVDGLPLSTTSQTSETMILPPGEHDVTVISRSVSGALLREVSLGISGAIVLVSSFSICIFLFLYIGRNIFKKKNISTNKV
jgi:uncharacterized protein YdaL